MCRSVSSFLRRYVMVACSKKDMVQQNDLRIYTLLPRESPLCRIGIEGNLLILVLMEYGLGQPKTYTDNITQMIPFVAFQMISAICGKMSTRTLSGGVKPLTAWQTNAVFFMLFSAARRRYCFMCYKRYCLRAIINKSYPRKFLKNF